VFCQVIHQGGQKASLFNRTSISEAGDEEAYFFVDSSLLAPATMI
jgi:hypothetical protein